VFGMLLFLQLYAAFYHLSIVPSHHSVRCKVYGKSGVFDAERLIDLLQALEKFVAVKDKGDGAAFKVDGLRGGMDLGTGGDFVGTKAVAASAANSGAVLPPPPQQQQQQGSSDAARDALRFLFSDEGDFFREFILDEVR